MTKISRIEVDEFFAEQLATWQTASDGFAALANVKVKTVKVGDASFKVQFNPARIRSSAAKVDAVSLKARKCFLCDENRPKEQKWLQWSDEYKILVNPYPIFPKHLTIPCCRHTPQSIVGRIDDMMRLAQVLDDYELFYNGPHCGASAPDHMHFQAGNKGFMPWLSDVASYGHEEIVMQTADAKMSIVQGLARTAVIIRAEKVDGGKEMFDELLRCLPVMDGDSEPMLNVLCSFSDGMWTITVFPRKKHRPSCYGDGEDCILVSPASVDMGGVIAVPLEKDFNKIGEKEITMIFDEVCYSLDEIHSMIHKLK